MTDVKMLNTKRSAMELSIGTIVVVVIAVTMLILGLVLVRTIMCSAIGLTGEINDKMKGEMNRLFQTTGGEVVCLGSGSESITLIPGKLNIIYCAVNAPEENAYYSFSSEITSGDVPDEWIASDVWGPEIIPPGDELPKKIMRINIPRDAGEQNIGITVTGTKTISSGTRTLNPQNLDFSIRRVGFLRSAMC